MHITVFFEAGTPPSDIIDNFLYSLGLDHELWLQPQKLDTAGRVIRIFGLPLPLDSVELAGSDTWECSFLLVECALLFNVNGRLVAADAHAGHDLKKVVEGLPKNLKRLSLTNLPLSNMEAVRALPQLTSLRLHSKSLTDVSVVSGLTHLTSLNLSGCESLTDVSALSWLTHLTSLDLSRCESLTDVSVVSGLTHLTSLDLGHCNWRTDVSVLSGLKQLTTLNLCRSKTLTDVSALSGLIHLTSLDLAYCDCLTDVSALSGLKQLTSLRLCGFKSLTDVSVLSGLSRLTLLTLTWCRSLTDVSGLSGLTQLVRLYIDRCEKVRDIHPLTSLSSLKTLHIGGLNRIRSIEPLRKLTSLMELKSNVHPALVAELLAHTAVLRLDKGHIAKNAKSWLEEVINFTDGGRIEQERLATTLGEAFSLLDEHEIIPRYEAFLDSRPEFSATPWKSWLQGCARYQGFSVLMSRVERLALSSISAGAVGGVCAALPDDAAPMEQQDWARGWLERMEDALVGHAHELLPSCAEICLAYARLDMKDALERWLMRFTDPSDPAALDPVQAALGQWQVARGDLDAALRHAAAVQMPEMRDPLMIQLAHSYLEKNTERAGEILLLIENRATTAGLVLRFAADETFVKSELNVHRLLVAAGDEPKALAALISAIHKTAAPAILDELSAIVQMNEFEMRDWKVKMMEMLLMKLRSEQK